MMPKHYLRLSELLSQTPSAIWPYRADEAVCVDTMGRAWLNPAANPYKALAIGEESDPVPHVHIERTNEGRWVLILQRSGLTLSGYGTDEKLYQWTPQTSVPPGWIPVDEIREVA